ncbi:MAG: endonuclease [Flavobacterium sp.]|jgi:endonuclease I|uniref:endonuclease n=1 Tax=Flavobacterium sp. TaxID=239 RepID=UPI0022BFBF38|nr:endonuclease [Flavobacterium sp.]MCZ8196841.1 endonuclease [Flavobacterium sp.]
MKKIFSLILFLSVTIGFAQTPYYPATYYNTATGTGYTLKTQLYNIIKSTISSGGYDGLYTTYLTSDRDYYYENDGTVLDMYSEKPSGTDSYNYSATNSGDRCGNYAVEGDCYNREHIIPQSVFNSNSPMVSDAHSVTPTDGKVNGWRSNYPHGKVGTASTTTQNGSKLGSASNTGYAAGYSGTVFEPIDEFKGDIARMYFYFATRYENVITTWGNSYAMFQSGSSTQVFTPTFKNILLTWHNQDPVNQREIDRNNAISARQHNRNPFIDHPEWVTAIWGSPLQTETFELLSAISVYPNPAVDNRITIESETVLDEIDLISINGQLMQQIKYPTSNNNTYTLENLPQGFYFLKLSSNNESITKKVIVN